MNFTVFITTFGIVFLAELGDKTQLTAMALAVRFPWLKTFIGLAAAFSLLNLFAVTVGKLAFSILPLFWIRLISAALFLFFGFTLLLAKDSDGDNDEGGGNASAHGAVVTSFLMILMAELGDKTQLVTASLAAQYDAPLEVFAGSTLALWVVSLLGIFAGRQLTRLIPLKFIHRAAAALFIIFGGVTVYQAISLY